MTGAQPAGDGHHLPARKLTSSQPERWSLTATVADVPRIRAFVGEAAARLGASTEAAFRLSLAVDELCANAVVHGYDGGPGLLELSLRLDGTAVALTIGDEAPAFDPTRVPLPTVDPPMSAHGPGGLGLVLVNGVIDRVEHRERGCGNVLTVTIDDRWSE